MLNYKQDLCDSFNEDKKPFEWEQCKFTVSIILYII